MLRFCIINVLTAFAVLAIIAGGDAWGAALMGENRQVQVSAEPLTATDHAKTAYHRPASIPFPANNPYTAKKAQLGRMLYYGPRLSASGTLSCASCHSPAFAYGDGLPKGVGNGMQPLRRRSPSILDSAWGERFMWDGRAISLEQQALGPIQNPEEMNEPLEHLVGRISQISDYRVMFALAFQDQTITAGRIAEAIATHERTIVSGISPFDRWIEGDEKAIPDTAKRGYDLFRTKAKCASCHTDWQLSDNGFHDIGLPDDDQGRGRLFPTVIKLQHAFKTPSLRETANRGPYMHDGSLTTLAAVVAHYNAGGISRTSQSELIMPLGLSDDEQGDIVAFLNALTSSAAPDFIPALPR
jgi:cytochrome c peroxidase